MLYVSSPLTEMFVRQSPKAILNPSGITLPVKLGSCRTEREECRTHTQDEVYSQHERDIGGAPKTRNRRIESLEIGSASVRGTGWR